MNEKIITEKSSMTVGDWNPKDTASYIIPFPEIEKHLADGWAIKQMSVLPYGVNGIAKASDLVITVHLQRL